MPSATGVVSGTRPRAVERLGSLVHRGSLADHSPGLQSQWAMFLACDEEAQGTPRAFQASGLQCQGASFIWLQLVTASQDRVVRGSEIAAPSMPGRAAHNAQLCQQRYQGCQFGPQFAAQQPGALFPQQGRRPALKSQIGGPGPFRSDPGKRSAGRENQPQETPRWCLESRLDLRSVLKRTPQKKRE